MIQTTEHYLRLHRFQLSQKIKKMSLSNYWGFQQSSLEQYQCQQKLPFLC